MKDKDGERPEDLRQWAREFDQVYPIRPSNKELGLITGLLREAANKIEELEKELKGAEGKLTMAEVVIEKYKRGELLPDPPMQTSSTADFDTPPAEGKKAEDAVREANK